GLRLCSGLLSPLRRALRASTPTWMIIPPGWGKRLTVEVLQREGVAGGTYSSCLEASRDAVVPRDAAAVFAITWPDPDPVIFERAAHELAVRSEVVVLAAFGPPKPAEWTVLQPKPRDDWRDVFVHWCVERVTRGARLDATECLEWLRHVDPEGDLADSPGALLPLLAWIHRHGAPTDEELVDVARVYLAERELEAPEDLVRDELDRRVEGHPERTLKELSARFGHERVDAMRQRGVLAFDGGSPQLFPTWLFEWFALETIRGVGESDWTVWGRWAAHPDFHDGVVDALVELEKSALMRNVELVLRDATDSLAHAGAVEALFEAAGARFAEEREQPPFRPKPADHEMLKRLAREQLRLVKRVQETRAGRPFRFTARTVDPSDADTATTMKWLSRAWSFSLAVTGHTEHEGMAWVMPAWASGDVLRWTEPVPPVPSPSSLDMLDEAIMLVRVARRLVRRTPHVVELPGWPFQLAALLEGHPFGAPLLDGFVGGYLGDVLESALATEDEETRARVATAVWDKLCEREGYPLAALDSIPRTGGLQRVLNEWLPGERFARPFDPAELVVSVQRKRHDLSRYPARLRDPLVRAIAEALTAMPVHQRDEFTVQLELDDLEHFDTLASLAVTRWQGASATKRAWQLDPDRALAALQSALTADVDLVGNWVGSAPLEESHRVAEALLAARPAPSSAMRRWLSERAGAGGRDATRLYALLVQLERSADDTDTAGE
ncbi:MAG: hypothetical protein KC586_04145, partial [Myxococcales bacterium]|nr:hypothetical protein [Myxococcales bacterium]